MHHLLIFAGISTLLIVTPGPDMALVTRNAVLHGRRAGLGAAAGSCLGLAIWTLAAAFGIATLVRASAVAFTVLKFAGAAYLFWLGVRAIASSRRAAGAAAARPVPRRPVGARSGLRQGLASNLANPKIAVFFTSLLPQFAGPGRALFVPCLLLGGLFAAMTLAWLSSYALAAARAAAVLTRPRVKAAIDRLTGAVLIAFGLRLATERR